MANKKTSDEVVAAPLDGAELVRIVQNGTSKRTTTAEMAAVPRRSISIGRYVIFEDDDGGLKIRNPDNSVTDLVIPT